MSSQKTTLTKDKSIKKKYTNKKKSSYKKLLFFIWALFFIGILSVFTFFYLLSKGLIVDLPDTKELENPKLSLASEIISSDDKTLGKFYIENRTSISYNDLPQNIIDALVSTEDERYFEHSGIDYEAIARAIVNVGQNGGGSTITQQLAKMLFSKRSKNKFERIMQKLGEWVVAIQLEKKFTKEEIIALYLNQFEFNWNAIGVQNASKLFFNKKSNDLNIEESAVLIGMLRSPSRYNPKRNNKRSRLRRDVVLRQMVKNEKLSQNKYDSLRLLPLELNYSKVNSKIGSATYFREFLKKEVTEILYKTEGIKKTDGSAYNIQLDGLKIYTTIDSRMQKNAESAVKKHLIKYQKIFNREKQWNKKFPFHGKTIGLKEIDTLLTKAMRRTARYKSLKKRGFSDDSIRIVFKKTVPMNIFNWKESEDTIMSPWDSIRYHKSILQAGLMSMEPQTGYVKSWVGGIDFNHFQYDHVKKGKRQIGSTFKPFIYVTAISEKHYSPCTMISNESFQYPGSTKKVKGGTGEVSLKKGLAMSLNPVALRLIQRTTPKPVIQLCKDLGITSQIKNNLTIALGSSDISLYEMVGAYSSFPNKGIYVKPVVVWRIENKDGQILYENKPETREVFSEEVAYAMIKIMRGSVDHPRGTSRRLRSTYGFKNQIASKTGTTNSNSDAWFIGFVPNLVTGIWVGHEDRAAHFASTANGQGAKMAMPIWAYYMKENYKNNKLGISNDVFEEPVNESEIDFNCSEYNGFKAFGKPQISPNESIKVDSIDINTHIQQQNTLNSDEELFD